MSVVLLAPVFNRARRALLNGLLSVRGDGLLGSKSRGLRGESGSLSSAGNDQVSVIASVGFFVEEKSGGAEHSGGQSSAAVEVVRVAGFSEVSVLSVVLLAPVFNGARGALLNGLLRLGLRLRLSIRTSSLRKSWRSLLNRLLGLGLRLSIRISRLGKSWRSLLNGLLGLVSVSTKRLLRGKSSRLLRSKSGGLLGWWLSRAGIYKLK